MSLAGGDNRIPRATLMTIFPKIPRISATESVI
jgi:hypothetical protein